MIVVGEELEFGFGEARGMLCAPVRLAATAPSTERRKVEKTDGKGREKGELTALAVMRFLGSNVSSFARRSIPSGGAAEKSPRKSCFGTLGNSTYSGSCL